MPDRQRRKDLRDRQASEVEESQRKLRESIMKTQELLDASDEMLKRHRQERNDES